MKLIGMHVIAEDIDDPDAVLLADRPEEQLPPRGLVMTHRVGSSGVGGPYLLQSMLANGSWTNSRQGVIPVEIDSETIRRLADMNDAQR